MLPKINRIKKKTDFDLIFKKGASFKSNPLILKVVKNGINNNRFGFIVSQKVSKKAAVRNKVRRRLSEIVQKNIVNFKRDLDIVFLALPGIEKKDYLETKELVEGLFKKAKCLNL